MNFEELKLGFKQYLLKNGGLNKKKYDFKSNDASVFLKSDEFKDYLSNELNLDTSVFNLSSKSIRNLRIEDGKIYNARSNRDKEDNINFDDITDEELMEMEDILHADDEDVKNIDGSDFIIDMLNELMEDEKFIETVDIDGDEEISLSELQNFLENVKGNDKDDNNISMRDLTKANKDIESGKLDLKGAEAEKVEKETPQTSSPSSAGSAGGAGGVGGYGGGGGGVSGSGGSNGSAEPAEKAVTLEELEAQKTEKEGELKEAQDEVSEVHSGENSEVKAAQDAADEKQEEYEKALEEDEKVSDELKEKAAENLEAINTQQSAVDETKGKISECEAKISSQQSTIAADEAQVSALEAAVASYDDAGSGDGEEAQAKKAEAQAALEQAQAQLQSDQEILAQYEQEKASQEAALTEQEAKLEELNQQKAEIEAEILENCDEKTKKAMETFNEAKDKVETVKTEQLEKAQQKVTTTQGELDKINQQINELKAQETLKEYSAKGKLGEAAVDFAYKQAGKGYGQMCADFPDATLHGGAWCADFVNLALRNSGNYENVPEWYRNCGNTAYCPTIFAAAQQANAVIDANQAQKGDLVLFDWDGGDKDHIGLFVGIENGEIVTIEGNTSDQVAERRYPIGDSRLAFCKIT